MTDSRWIRNYAIIAHIGHGKSTLADQFLLKTGAITAREFRNQVLDDMDLERERGITIQMHPVTVYHQHDGQTYELNLIDTPGHVDFSYEVSRSLAACEGVILLVDAFQGVVVYVRVKEGVLRKGQRVRLMEEKTEFEVADVGQFRPAPTAVDELTTGQVGYFTANIKNIKDVHIGDTVTEALRPAAEALHGYKEPKPMVFSGLYPTNNSDFENLREALAKLQLNDSSFSYAPEVSEGLGFGFRCGFLGMLHREIIQQ